MDIEVCVETEHFTLGQAGCHWHISVAEPGEHRIEVLLADGEHRDLEEGDAITVVPRALTLVRLCE